jgi:hypothetical protein
VVYKFFSDIDHLNKMDDKPFFTLSLDLVRKHDLKTLESFTKNAFDTEKIVQEAGNLMMQSLISKELQAEFQQPSDEFVRLIAGRVQTGRFTSQAKETFSTLIVNSVSLLIRDKVNERLTSALTASNPSEEEGSEAASNDAEVTFTSEEEIAGFNIVRAIASRVVNPKRIVIRDAKSYCAILLDDNNRKTTARLHFNSPTARYFGTFTAGREARSG